MNTETSSIAPSVFDSFNARSLAAEQVAKTFVPSSAFYTLSARSHSTVIGPRGSGKTSMLKMLQPRALENWTAPEANDYRGRIDYTGVFVPTDITWNRQTVAIVEGLSSELKTVLRGAAFTTQVLHELVDSFIWRTRPSKRSDGVSFRRVNLSTDKERALVRQLSTEWQLSPDTDTLIGLKHSLAARHIKIWTYAQEAVFGKDKVDLENWLMLEFLSSCSFAVELFDDYIDEPEARWALLFDELELAPEWIMKGLLTALRSTNPKFLYKLAVSPFNEQYEDFQSALQGMPDQDYNEILLWHPRKEEGFAFTERLFLNICSDWGISARNASKILGPAILDLDGGNVTPYTKGSVQYKVFSKALAEDTSFRRYWKDNRLDLDSLSSLGESDKAAKVRKVYPLVLIRNFFRTPPGTRLAQKQQRRSRKTLKVYTGAAAIFAIAEGNPRWIIGLSRLLLEKAKNSPSRVPRSDQAKFVDATIHKFRARLKTISIAGLGDQGKAQTLLRFLDQIGEYFRKCVIVDEFQTQPPLAFTVDAHASPELIIAIGRAVNAGALVYSPEKGSLGLINNVKGKRFRLSYMLAPWYGLPLRLGGEVSLSSIILPGKKKRKAKKNDEMSLFPDVE